MGTYDQAITDVLSLVCARDAFLLRQRLSEPLWECVRKYLKVTPDNWSEKLSWLNPESVFTAGFHELISRDVDNLWRYWRNWKSLSDQSIEKKESWSIGLSPDTQDADLRSRTCKELGDLLRNKSQIAGIANLSLRYSVLRKNMQTFWIACGNYFGSSDKQPEGNFEQELLEKWGNLFTVLVIPVCKESDAYFLRMLCPDPRYKGIHTIRATTDEAAYKAFYDYVAENALANYKCDEDVLARLSGGIRSLNCYVFNDLGILTSVGDHPAALLWGCRSGAQYQVRLDTGAKHSIIGMIAVYAPLYDFFKYCGFPQVGGSLMEIKSVRKTNSQYIKLWSDRLNGAQNNKERQPLSRVLIEPFCNLSDEEINKLLDHITLISLRWDKIFERTLPQDVKSLVNDLDKHCLDYIQPCPLDAWIGELCRDPEIGVISQRGTLSKILVPPLANCPHMDTEEIALETFIPGERILFLGAHCDDSEIGCGGTAAKMAATGHVIAFAVAADCGRVRKKEATAAAHQLNLSEANNTLFFGLIPVNRLEERKDVLQNWLESIEEQFQPDTVFVHHRSDTHADHKTLYEVSIRVFKKETILTYHIPKLAQEATPFQPNQFEDISSFIKNKLLLCACHKSQANKDVYLDPNQIQNVASITYRSAYGKSGGYAEGFYIHVSRSPASFNAGAGSTGAGTMKTKPEPGPALKSITTKEESSVVTAPRMTKEILGLDKVRGKVDIGILTVRQDEFELRKAKGVKNRRSSYGLWLERYLGPYCR